MGSILTVIFAMGLVILLIAYSSFAWGYVASIMYKWFIISLFPTLPILLWWQFAGIMFFVNCFVHSGQTHNFKDDVLDKQKGITTNLLAPWISLLCAYIFKLILY